MSVAINLAEGPVLSASEAIAAFAARPVPALSLQCARLRLLDCLGNALAATRVPPARATLAAAQAGFGAGPARLLGFGGSLAPCGAALVNAVLIHALDFDDTYLAGAMHISAMTVAASLAAADLVDAPLTRVVAASAAGTEAACQIGRIAPRLLHGRGFQPTALIGAIGAAVAAGHVLGLSPAQMSSAVGTCTSVAAGLCQFEESWVKNWNVGWAAQTGLAAALVARADFQGPRESIEGEKGLFAAHGQLALEAPVTLPAPGDGWESDAIALKKYGCCHFIHAAIDAALHLHRQVDPARIARVRVLVPQLAVNYTAIPIDFRRRPTTVYRARFAGPWIIARALIEGEVTLATFDAVDAAPQAALSLADRTEFVVTEFDNFPRDWPGTVEIELQDGTVLREYRSGAPEALHPENRAIILGKMTQNLAYAGLAPETAAIEAILARPDATMAEFWSVLPVVPG